MTYDRGRLEIMTLSLEHERIKRLLSRLIDVLSEELKVRMASCGSTTFRHVEFDRGLEPDECYYIKNLDRIRGHLSIDLHRDPPPDFVIEIDVSNRSIDRLPIYSRLGVPEVWRWEKGEIFVLHLGENGEYIHGDTSSLFVPNLNVAELLPFIKVGLEEDDFTISRQFRVWLKQYLADRGLAS